MDNKSMFNLTLCIIAIFFLGIHSVNIFLKKNKRNDEKSLFAFIVFTYVHFATYLTFTIIKVYYTSNAFIMAFYTTFYIMNNIEALLLFNYATSYIAADKKTVKVTSIINLLVFGILVLLDVINLFTHIFFYAEGGIYMRSKTMIISQIYQFVSFAIVFFLTLFNKKLNVVEKLSFGIYCILPFIAIIVQNFLPGYAIAYLSIIVSIEILFLLVNVRKNTELAEEKAKRYEAEIKTMMSQIQPHFTYNTLSSISTLININPEKAQNALDIFTDYLRNNLSLLSDASLIPFKDELRHTELYLFLEKMRFEERLNIVYEVETGDFFVPPLTLQPIVENAVKHGILKKLEGGTIKIRAYEDSVAYNVEVIDDGIGFDTGIMKKLDNSHIGMNNVKYRINSMCKGNMKITSEIGKGTTVTLSFYK